MYNCLVSKIPLDCGSKASLLILIKHESIENQYSPFGFMIHGEIDMYYELTNIVRDENVELLEDFFGLSIEEIISNLDGNIEISNKFSFRNKLKNSLIYKLLSPCYFNTDMLTFLIKSCPNKTGFGEFMSYLREKESKEYYVNYKKYLINNAINNYSICHISSDRNMFNLLNIDSSFETNILELYNLITNLYLLNIILIPNYNQNSSQNNECYLLEFYQNKINILMNHLQNKINTFPNCDDRANIIQAIREYKLNKI